MSSFWFSSSLGGATAWHSVAIAEPVVDLAPPLGLARALARFGDRGGSHGVALLVRDGLSIWVNGHPVLGGLKILAHRDELLAADGRTFYYSDESTPVVCPFALQTGTRRPRCAVCRQSVEDGQLVVACPRCGRVFHQIPPRDAQQAKHCWTYTPQCLCGHPTSMDAGATWHPEKELCDESRQAR